MIGTIASLFSTLLCLTALRAAFKKGSYTSVIWAYAGVMSLMVIVETLLGTVSFTFGASTHIMDDAVMTKAAIYILLFNLAMLLGMRIVEQHRFIRLPLDNIYDVKNFPPALLQIGYALLAIFVVAAVMYCQRAGSYTTYAARYYDTDSAWSLVLVTATCPLVGIGLCMRSRVLQAAAVIGGVVLVGVTQLRYFALFNIAPVVLFHLFNRRNQRKARQKNASARRVTIAVLVCGGLVLAAQGVLTMRDPLTQERLSNAISLDSVAIPELWMTKRFLYGSPGI